MMLKALSSWIFQIPRGGTFTQQNRLLRDVVAVMLFVCFCHLNPVSISVLVYAFHQLLWSGLERFFLKGQKERTWRQLCCMSVGTQTCPCTPSVFYATDDKHKKFIPLLWAKRSPKLWQMLSPAQRNL